MFAEIIPTIVDILILKKVPLTIEQLIELSEFDSAHVGRAIVLLKELGLIDNIMNKYNVPSFQLIKELKGIHLAKAAQIGIDLSSFNNGFVINPKEKQLALDLATKSEKIKILDIGKRKPLFQKRSYLSNIENDDIFDNLVILLESTSSSLYEHLEQLAKKDNYLKLLLTMHEQAEKSLENYANSLKN